MNDVRDDAEFDGEEDRRLGALLRSTHAPANPAVWRRVRAELESAPARAGAFDAVLAWFTRPAALAAASMALVLALGAGASLLPAITSTTASDDATMVVASESATLMESLLDDTAAAAVLEEEDAGFGEDAGDAPTDSGGRS